MNPKEKQRQARNFLLKSIAIVGIFVGLVLLLRGWGLGQQSNQNFVADQDVTPRSLLPINTILSIAGVSVPPSGGPKSTWASDITSVVGLPATKGLWLVEKKSNATVVGQFTQDKFIPHVVFPERLLVEKLFGNGKLWGLTTPGSNAQLLLGFVPANKDQLVKLYEFPRNRVVVDVQLATKDQEIYFAWGEQGNQAQNISVVRPTGELLPVFTTNHYQIVDILAAQPENNAIYFGAFVPDDVVEQLCFKLNLQNSAVTNIPCGAVPDDGQPFGFELVKNSINNGWDVYKYSRSGANPELSFPASTNLIRQHLARQGDKVLWVETAADGTVTIPVYNANSLQLVKRLELLPGAEPLQLWMIGDSVVVLGRVKQAEMRLFVENPEGSPFSESASSTESLTSSATEVGFEIEQQMGWKMYTLDGCSQNCDISILKY